MAALVLTVVDVVGGPSSTGIVFGGRLQRVGSNLSGRPGAVLDDTEPPQLTGLPEEKTCNTPPKAILCAHTVSG